MLAVFFGTVCLRKCLSAFCDGICDFRRPPGFSRTVDAAERNGRSGSIIEEFGKGTGVSRWDSRWEEISGKRDSDIVEESREAPTLERESANSLPGRENDQVSIEDELP